MCILTMYTFPFSTCERPNPTGIAQPYSAALNMINSVVIFYFLIHTKHYYTALLLFLILCFELFHSFSHIIHLASSIQETVIHMLAVMVNGALLFFFYKYLKVTPAPWFLLFCLGILGLDVYLFLNMSILYYFASQIILFLSILFYHYPLLTKPIQDKLHLILILTVAIFLLFLNEKNNCERMLEVYTFPYHIMIEILGIGLFYTLCSTVYKL